MMFLLSSCLVGSIPVIDQEAHNPQLHFFFGCWNPTIIPYVTNTHLGGTILATPLLLFFFMANMWEIEPLIQVNCAKQYIPSGYLT
jgi:hypothetical protein